MLFLVLRCVSITLGPDGRGGCRFFPREKSLAVGAPSFCLLSHFVMASSRVHKGEMCGEGFDGIDLFY